MVGIDWGKVTFGGYSGYGCGGNSVVSPPDAAVAEADAKTGTGNPPLAEMLSPKDGLITNTPIVPVIIRRDLLNCLYYESENSEPTIAPMTIKVNGSEQGINYCPLEPYEQGWLTFLGYTYYETCHALIADVSLQEGPNVIEAEIPVRPDFFNDQRVEVFHQTVTVTYDPNYSTSGKELIYSAAWPCPSEPGKSPDIAIIDPVSGTAFGKIKTTADEMIESNGLLWANPGLHLSPDSSRLYFVGRQGVHYIDTGSNRITDTVDFSPIASATLYRDKKLFLTTVGEKINYVQYLPVFILDLETKQVEGEFTIPDDQIATCVSMAFHPKRPKLYFTQEGSGEFMVFDAENYKFVKMMGGTVVSWACHKEFGVHPSGKWGVLLGNESTDGYLNIFDAESDEFVRTVKTPNNEDNYYMAFSPAKNIVYTNGYENGLTAYSYDQDKVLWQTHYTYVDGPLVVAPDEHIYARGQDVLREIPVLIEIDPADGSTIKYLYGDRVYPYIGGRVYKQ